MQTRPLGGPTAVGAHPRLRHSCAKKNHVLTVFDERGGAPPTRSHQDESERRRERHRITNHRVRRCGGIVQQVVNGTSLAPDSPVLVLARLLSVSWPSFAVRATIEDAELIDMVSMGPAVVVKIHAVSQ